MSNNTMFRQRPIEGSTALCVMLGYPASHSLAPIYFSEILETIGADCVYLCFDINAEQLENAIIGCRAMNIRGMVITAPHKVAVMQYLDEIDSMAEKIGSVNVVVNRNGRLVGYNMDAVGFMLPLTHGFYIKEEVLLPRRKITYIDRDEELFPGVEVIMLPGHSPCVLGLILHFINQVFIFTSDAVNERRNYNGHPPGALYDSLAYQESILKIKRLQKRYNARVVFGHDMAQLAELKLVPDFYQ